MFQNSFLCGSFKGFGEIRSNRSFTASRSRGCRVERPHSCFKFHYACIDVTHVGYIHCSNVCLGGEPCVFHLFLNYRGMHLTVCDVHATQKTNCIMM